MKARKKRKPAPRPHGRPAFQPTDRQREDVKLMTFDGMGERDIASALGIDRLTLRKYFTDELVHGRAIKRLEVLRRLDDLSKGQAAACGRMLKRSEAHYRPPTVESDAKAAPAKEPRAPKLGKKEQAQVDAARPDPSSEMGELMARRMAETATSTTH